MPGKSWTREEEIIVFNLYTKVPFGQIDTHNPRIQKLANSLERSAGSVSMKMANFASFDPALKNRGVVGLQNVTKLDKIIWNDFHANWDELAFESESLIASLEKHKLEDIISDDNSPDSLHDLPVGKERETIVKTRVNQQFFRNSILSSYNGKCCITGLAVSGLLVASHIIPWSVDKENRTNPRNGLCLNSLHDKAFDSGLITITSDFKVRVSSLIVNLIESDTISSFFLDFEGKNITLPERFTPDPIFLEYHAQNVFQN